MENSQFPENSDEQNPLEVTEDDFTWRNVNTQIVFGELRALTPIQSPPPSHSDLAQSGRIDVNSPPSIMSSGSAPDNFNQTIPALPPDIARNSESVGEQMSQRTFTYCRVCGAQSDLSDRFCTSCGSASLDDIHKSPALISKDPITLIGWEQPGAEATSLISSESHQPQTYTPPPTAAADSKSRRKQLLEKGEILAERYQIVKYLGRGGFSQVVTVVDSTDILPDEQALKLIFAEENPYSISLDELKFKFQSQYKEWKVLCKAAPDFIARLYRVEKLDEGIGIFMEYMEGGDLSQLVQSWGGKPQTYEQLRHLLRLLVQVCRGVKAIHKLKLIHRDIKPANILLDEKREKCKICDFELLIQQNEAAGEHQTAGTIHFMSPESLAGETTTAADIYSLGVTFYHLLGGEFPFKGNSIYEIISKKKDEHPKPLPELNSLVSPELDRLVQWCLEYKPEDRPPDVEELLAQLLALGVESERNNYAPDNLARLLLKYLAAEDREMMVNTLRDDDRKKYRSMSTLPEHQEQDIIEEYCFTESPFVILREHCGGRVLYAIADALGVDRKYKTRDNLIAEIVTALGFLPGKREIHGLEAMARNLENLLERFENSENLDECTGYLNRAFDEIEDAVDLLISFYGQMIHGAGLNRFLVQQAKGKTNKNKTARLAFGEKVGALRSLCKDKPEFWINERVERAFRFPIISPEVIRKLETVVEKRNNFAHGRVDLRRLQAVKSFGLQTLPTAVEVVEEFGSNRLAPKLLQITSSQIDFFGKHFYEAINEKGNREKIFTTYGLNVGEIYSFFPFTNPARINPLIFPFQKSE